MVELANIDHIVLVAQHSALVVVVVKVVRCRKERNHRRESCFVVLAVHAVTRRERELERRFEKGHVPSILRFVRSNHGKKFIFIQKLAGSLKAGRMRSMK